MPWRVGMRATARPEYAPLSEMARLIRPFASGEPTIAADITAPADSPNTVTFFGSPPNAAIFACTHLSAAIVSSSAWLPDAL